MTLIYINPSHAQCNKMQQMYTVVASCRPQQRTKETMVLAGGSCCIEQQTHETSIINNSHQAYIIVRSLCTEYRRLNCCYIT